MSFFLFRINMKPIVFGIYGVSNSGKTNLIVELVKTLKFQGFKVAAVKKSDKNIGIDTNGKDTYKYGEAGSDLVVFSSPVETDFLIKNEMDEDEIVQNIKKMLDVDIILVEGCIAEDVPKIKIGNIADRKNTIMVYENNFEQILNMIKTKYDGV